MKSASSSSASDMVPVATSPGRAGALAPTSPLGSPRDRDCIVCRAKLTAEDIVMRMGPYCAADRRAKNNLENQCRAQHSLEWFQDLAKTDPDSFHRMVREFREQGGGQTGRGRKQVGRNSFHSILLSQVSEHTHTHTLGPT